MSPSLYFAYGSNMDRAHMTRMCPRAKAYGPARIKNYRFFITASGHGSIAPHRGANAWGVLWHVTAVDVAALDRYEDLAGGLYRQEMLPVHHDEKLLSALVYIATDTTPGRARPQYRAQVIGAAREWKLPEDYVRDLERAFGPG
ncbi:MAG TPA: gamma-glutamylcyclotransferase family protein [Xanthobacteraceae bacterium]